MSDNAVVDQSQAFAIRIVRLYQFLVKEHNEYTLGKQILRCGTSIGANIAESQYAASTSDFINKLRIALKEANETAYWLDLLIRTDYIPENLHVSLSHDCNSMIALLVSIINSSSKNS